MDELADYITRWENDYQARLSQIPLLDQEQARKLSSSQKKYFAQLFWHARGHFAEFLWVLGSRAPDRKSKLIILENIADEFGARDDDHTAHELLYNRFARALGADTREQITLDAPQFLKDYNREHLKFLLRAPWDACSAAFSAYERLDNFDYGAVEEIGKSWLLDRNDLQFFEVHRKSDHFGEVSEGLRKIHTENSQALERGFKFIGDHQIKMWNDLSGAILNQKY